MNLYFTVEFRTCHDLLSTSIGLRTCSSLICNASVQFQKKTRKISRRRSGSPQYQELGHFTLSFFRGRPRNVPRIISTCTAIVLLIKPFVLWRSRCRCRRGLLKVPNEFTAPPIRHVTSKGTKNVISYLPPICCFCIASFKVPSANSASHL